MHKHPRRSVVLLEFESLPLHFHHSFTTSALLVCLMSRTISTNDVLFLTTNQRTVLLAMVFQQSEHGRCLLPPSSPLHHFLFTPPTGPCVCSSVVLCPGFYSVPPPMSPYVCFLLPRPTWPYVSSSVMLSLGFYSGPPPMWLFHSQFLSGFHWLRNKSRWFNYFFLVQLHRRSGPVRLVLKPADKLIEADLLWEKNTIYCSW